MTAKFYAKLKAPTTDTYTLYIEVDDTARLYINSNLLINQGGNGNFSATCKLYLIIQISHLDSFDQNQFYDLELYWSENTGAAELRLYWSYTGVAQTIIDSQYFYYPTYITGSPLQVVVSCPNGYTGSNTSSPTACEEICGDGVVVGSEQCDNRNVLDGDGCNSTWYIEDDWACYGGSSSHHSTCIECTAGFIQNSNKDNWIIMNTPDKVKLLAIIYFILFLILIKVVIATSFL